MARKKKSGGTSGLSVGPSSRRRVSVSIEQAENGSIINISGEGKNGEYHSKSLVAPNDRAAFRIAAAHLSGASGKTKSKKEKGKKGAAKMSLGKKG